MHERRPAIWVSLVYVTPSRERFANRFHTVRFVTDGMPLVNSVDDRRSLLSDRCRRSQEDRSDSGGNARS